MRRVSLNVACVSLIGHFMLPFASSRPPRALNDVDGFGDFFACDLQGYELKLWMKKHSIGVHFVDADVLERVICTLDVQQHLLSSIRAFCWACHLTPSPRRPNYRHRPAEATSHSREPSNRAEGRVGPRAGYHPTSANHRVDRH